MTSDGGPADLTYQPFPSFAEFARDLRVPEALAAFEQLLDQVRADADVETLNAARQRLTDYAAIETGALEGLYEAGRGFTVTVAAHGAVLESIRLERGEGIARVVADQLEAFEIVLDMATRSVPVTEVFIRHLHEVITRNQKTYRVYTEVGPQERELIPGAYKMDPNNPYRGPGELAHAYAPVVDTAPEMSRFTSELQSGAFAEAHPVLQAAYAHFGFVAIHPFPDGNGRVARALASVYTYRRPGVPMLIFDDEKQDYLQALEQADSGRHQPFVDFVTERVIEAIQLVQEHIETSGASGEEQVISRLQRTLQSGIGELSHLEADALALHLLDLAAAAVQEWLNETQLPDGVTINTTQFHVGGGQIQPPAGFRPVINSPRNTGITINAVPPAQANVHLRLAPFVALTGEEMYALQLRPLVGESNTLAGQPFGARLSEVRPQATQALLMRLKSWVRRLVRVALTDAADQAESSLRSQGYLRP